jgi:hypothetical protein
MADTKPAPDTRAPSFSPQQVTDAMTKICAAYEKVHHSLVLSSARNGGSDPTAVLAIATSGRQVLDAGSRYLITKLSEGQALAPELATAIRNLANTYQELAMSYLNGLTNSDAELQPTLQAADDAVATIEHLCKSAKNAITTTLIYIDAFVDICENLKYVYHRRKQI